MVELQPSSVLKNSQKDNLEDSNSERFWLDEVGRSRAVKAQALKEKSNFTTGEINAPSPAQAVADSRMEGRNGEAGPSGEDPASSVNFASPLRTLKESISDYGHDFITIHDLIEAYNSLSNDIRAQADYISSTRGHEPFLMTFKTYSFDIIECLTRDIRRALPSPFESQHIAHSTDLSFGFEIPSDDELQTMSDNATLSQYALRFASDIFIFPALYSNFTDIQLTSLLRDSLSFCTTPVSNIFNLPKLRAMAIWTLKVQQLPSPIMSSLKVEILSSLRSSISHQLGEDVSKLDAFKSIHCILISHLDFVASFTELLPLVLEHLCSDSPQIQLHAALALAGFASAKLRLASDSKALFKRVSEIIKTFIDAHTFQKKSSETSSPLMSSFIGALADGIQWRKRGPSYALTVVSCFLVLLDHYFFAHPRSVKMVFNILQQCAGLGQRKTIRNVQPEMWKILFWAFSRMPLVLDQNLSSGQLGLRERAYRLVCEDLRGDRHLSLIRILLRKSSSISRSTARSEVDVRRAIDIAGKLFSTGDEPSAGQAVAIFSRLMVGIGSPTKFAHDDDGREVFPQALIDGSLLSQTTRDLTVPTVMISIDQLCPLSEQEVLSNWDSLCALWVSIVQRHLSCGRTVSTEIVEVWQALLLVHGEPTPGEQNLSASPAFSRRIGTIITCFQAELDDLEKQRLYLSTIWKFWSVMKNVFTLAWLSHPAEKILASLLKTQFVLDDGNIKELWRQLCGDLISVGIPVLLHVLHVRSKKQEGIEVTRQLWLLLAIHGPLKSEKENWEALLQFLAMPFSAWNMSAYEFDIWKDIFSRASKIAAGTSQAIDHVITRFLSLFEGAELASLKTYPRTLHWLFLQLTASNGSLGDISFLTLIDDCLLSSYAPSAEAKLCTLEILRLIGRVISNINHTEVVLLISVLQRGMACWIADEGKILNDQEDKELVDVLYKPCLQLLAEVQPSIEVLSSVATFVHSVFVRIRGDGPLAFHKFWRSTYHGREDILSKDYPVPIQLCLKAWSDITADSLADGLSLASGSQSVQSCVISGSQPMEGVETDIVFDISNVVGDGPLHVVTHDYSEDLDFDPVLDARSKIDSRAQDLEPVLPSMQTGDYTDKHSFQQDADSSPSETVASAFPDLLAVVAKRSADNELPRTPKKPRTDNIGMRKSPGTERHKISSYGPHSNISTPESVVRESSPYPAPRKFGSQKRHRSQSPFWIEGRMNLCGELTEEAMVSSDDVDYDSWEQGLSTSDLKVVQEELQPDLVVPDSDEYSENTEPLTEPDDSDAPEFLSPSLSVYPLPSRRRQRSQTAPEFSPASRSLSVPQPLRRNQTTPLDRQKPSSAQLEALRQAYAIVADTGTSQIDVQDIMQARRLANQINQVLDEQMFSKVVGGNRN